MSAVAALAACIVIESASISAADLARAVPQFAGVPAAAVVGPAPGPGARRVFSPGELVRLARRFGLGSTKFDPVCVEQRVAPLSHSEVLDAVRAAAGGDVAIELVDFSRTPVPRGTVEFTRARGDIWSGRVRYGENRTIPIWAKVRGATDVSRGDPVTVDVFAGAARVSFPGRAQTAGSVGDTILVQRDGSPRKINARVVGKGKVSVNANGPYTLRGDVGRGG